jgi:hypothetical protein
MANSKISALTSATTPVAGTEVLPIVQTSATKQVSIADLTAGRSVSMSAGTISSGNLTFSSTGQRITGDFSNATIASRMAFQTSTTDALTSVGAIPNGTSANTQFDAFSSADPTNSSVARFAINSTDVRILSTITGTGTYRPMTFFTGGSERARIDTSGNVGIGVTPAVKLDVLGTVQAAAAATQDAVRLAGRAGGTGTFAVTLTPTTLTASRTLTLPDATTTVVGTDVTQTLTNKWVQPRVLASTANSATPTLNTDNYDMMVITGQTVAITSFSTNLTGTPVNGQKLIIAITGTGAIGITWGASFEASTVALPTTTVTTNRLDVGFIWNVATTKWRCVAVA